MTTSDPSIGQQRTTTCPVCQRSMTVTVVSADQVLVQMVTAPIPLDHCQSTATRKFTVAGVFVAPGA